MITRSTKYKFIILLIVSLTIVCSAFLINYYTTQPPLPRYGWVEEDCVEAAVEELQVGRDMDSIFYVSYSDTIRVDSINYKRSALVEIDPQMVELVIADIEDEEEVTYSICYRNDVFEIRKNY